VSTDLHRFSRSNRHHNRHHGLFHLTYPGNLS
jgi:hypothetical protein